MTENIAIKSDIISMVQFLNGESTIKARSSNQNASLKFYSSWFCPYAQRVWIALEEKGIDYQYIEINPYEDPVDVSNQELVNSSSSSTKKFTKIALSLSEKRLRYPRFIEASPKGLVPAISYHAISDNQSSVDAENVADSMVLLEYLEEKFPSNSGQFKPLIPKHYMEPVKKSHIRFWCVHINERIIPHYYKMLTQSSTYDRQLAQQNLLSGLKELAQAMAPAVGGLKSSANIGPFFLGEEFSLVDVSLVPWFMRMQSVLKHYRLFEIPSGYETITIPPTPPTSDSEDEGTVEQIVKRRCYEEVCRNPQHHKTKTEITDEDFVRLQVWYNAVRQRPSVCATLADKKELILNYADYADGTATSDVAHRFGNVSAGAAEAVVSNTSHEDLVVMNEQDYNGGYDYAYVQASYVDHGGGGGTAQRRSSKHKQQQQPLTLPVKDIPIHDHVVGHLIDLPHFQHVRGTNFRARLACRVCGQKSSAFCITCSADPATGQAYRDTQYLFAICNPTVGRLCFQNHCQHEYV